jgi:hypothetical protein
MRRTWSCIALGLAASVVLTACGGDDDKSKTSSTSSTAKTASTKARVRPQRPKVPAARPSVAVGRVQTVPAPAGGGRPSTVLAVKVAAIVDPLDATPFQSKALARKSRFVGVRLTIVNKGPATWVGSPGSGLTAITTRDTQAAKGGNAGTCGGSFVARAEIPPGTRQRGCITLVLRKGERVRTIQWAPGGAGALSAEWTAKRRRR